MPRRYFPADVLHFLESRIDSVPHLESLLLFWQGQRASWGEGDIAARVYVSVERGCAIIADLARYGFITPIEGQPGRYVYDPAWDDSRMMERLAELYRQHVVLVASLIHEKAATGAVRDFARAFQLKDGD
jgi:hypothetical protein